MPVGGSRHYTGAGLGAEGLWTCPSCGEENVGPLAQGCASCGAGRPGHRVSDERATPLRPDVEDDPPPRLPDPRLGGAGQGDLATWWASQHPAATVEEAYRAGYEDAVRAIRTATIAAKQRQDAERFSTAGKTGRTLVAALSLFRDQVLTTATEEIATGEWCSIEEVNQLIAQLTATEAARA